MKELNLDHVKSVSGGDFILTLDAHVESSVGGWVTDLLSQLVDGSLSNTTAFANALSNAIANGANFNDVRLEGINFSRFN